MVEVLDQDQLEDLDPEGHLETGQELVDLGIGLDLVTEDLDLEIEVGIVEAVVAEAALIDNQSQNFVVK